MKRRYYDFLLGLVCVFLLAGPMVQASPSTTPSEEEVFALIGARLELMPAVAHFKAANGLAIEDLEREQVVLQQAIRDAEQAGLNPDSVRAFFIAQIAAAKTIQYRERALLLFADRVPDPPDLTGEIRPRLLELGSEFVVSLEAHLQQEGLLQASDLPAFLEVVDHLHLNRQERETLFRDLIGIQLAE